MLINKLFSNIINSRTVQEFWQGIKKNKKFLDITNSRTVQEFWQGVKKNKKWILWPSGIVFTLLLVIIIIPQNKKQKNLGSSEQSDLNELNVSITKAYKKTDPFVRERFIQKESKRLGLTSDEYKKLFALHKPDAAVLPDAPAGNPLNKIGWFCRDLSRMQRLKLIWDGLIWVISSLPSLAILLGGGRFLLEIPQREKQAKNQAWQLIDGARGTRTSGARFQALEELCEGGTSLKGLDADGVDLTQIKLPGANLERASLENAVLCEATLTGVNLRYANLRKANLRKADFQEYQGKPTNFEGAILEEANMEECKLAKAQLGRANLRKAILYKADLRNTNFTGADLTDVNLCDADVNGANFSSANIQGAILKNVKNLKIEQINKADNYQQAKYDEDFCSQHPEENLTRYEMPKIENVAKKELIPQILQQIQELMKLREPGDVLPDDSVVKDFIDNLNSLASLISQDRTISNDCKSKIAEIEINLRSSFEQNLTKWNKTHQNRENAKIQAVDFAEKLKKRPVSQPSQWLKDQENITLLRTEGIRYFLEANSQNNLIIHNRLDREDNLHQLAQDIDKCLELIRDNKKLEDEEIKLHFSFDVYLEIFEAISRQVIPEFKKNKPGEFTNEMSPRLVADCDNFIEDLQSKLDSKN